MTKRIHLIRSRILYVFQSVWSVAVLIGVLFAISIINVGCHRGDHLKPEELQAVASHVNRLEDIERCLIAVSGFILDPLRFATAKSDSCRFFRYSFL